MITSERANKLMQTLLYSSLFGLNVKVFSRDTEYFPGGWQFHSKKDFMKRLINGETTDTYIFHMSWTENKDNKLLFFRQLGQWFVEEQCVGKNAEEILGSDEIKEGASLVQPCCAVEALVSCHYPDKPCVRSCQGKGGNIDKHGKSFWG